MTDYALAGLLGVIEGLTEFLPISSTAHLRIAEALLHLDLADPFWKMFSIVIQLGAVLCLPIYFRGRIAQLLRTYPQGADGDRGLLTHPLGLVIIAFVTTAVPAFLLTKIIGQQLENLRVMAVSLLVGGIVMWAIDWRSAAIRSAITSMDEMSMADAVWIGACQILSAVFPGTSRSMATITAGELAGMSRASALEFSFFVSIPTMLVATGYALLRSMHGDAANPVGVGHIDGHQWTLLVIGLLVSFAVAYVSVVGFMAWVRRRGLAPFAVYRILAGAAVLTFLSRAAS